MFGAGYVLGTRAGRERYEQLRLAAQRFTDGVDGSSIRAGLESVSDRLERYAAEGGSARRGRGDVRRRGGSGRAAGPPASRTVTVRRDGRAVEDSTVIRAVVHARLLGLRLLTLDARVVVAPAAARSGTSRRSRRRPASDRSPS